MGEASIEEKKKVSISKMELIIIGVIIIIIAFLIWDRDKTRSKVEEIQSNNKLEIEKIRRDHISYGAKVESIGDDITDLKDAISTFGKALEKQTKDPQTKKELQNIINRLENEKTQIKDDYSNVLEQLNIDAEEHEEELSKEQNETLLWRSKAESYALMLDSQKKQYDSTIQSLREELSEHKFEKVNIIDNRVILKALDKDQKPTSKNSKLEFIQVVFQLNKSIKKNDVLIIMLDNGKNKAFEEFGIKRFAANNSIYCNLQVPKGYKFKNTFRLNILHNSEMIYEENIDLVK